MAMKKKQLAKALNVEIPNEIYQKLTDKIRLRSEE